MGTSKYVYMGAYDVAQFGGSMTLEGREITIPDQVVAKGDTIELDDDYVVWVGSRGAVFLKADDPLAAPYQQEPAAASSSSSSSTTPDAGSAGGQTYPTTQSEV